MGAGSPAIAAAASQAIVATQQVILYFITMQLVQIMYY